VIKLLRSSLKAEKCNYYHEVINDMTKIFFDVDMVIPKESRQLDELKDLCGLMLADDDLYAYETLSAHGSELE
jgi:hypothetical protein